MKNKIIIICLVVIILSIVVSLGIKLYLNKDLEKKEQNLQDTYEKYGLVEMETVNNLVAKFNTQIMDNGLNTPASNDYMTVKDNIYWFALTDSIYYFLKPIKFSNIENDIVNMNALYFKKDNYNEVESLKYVKFLIKANNEEITDSEIENLIKEAKEKSSFGLSSNNGKGISISFVETDDHYEYQVVRLYK